MRNRSSAEDGEVARTLAELLRPVALRLRAQRRALGMSRATLAARADVSERYLAQLENGTANASLGVLLRVTGALGMTPQALFTDASAPPAAAADGDAVAAVMASLTLREQADALALLRRFSDERRRARRGVALLGLRGAGKSTLGPALARATGLAFVRLTRRIEEHAGIAAGELFSLAGPEAYRRLESEAVAALIAEGTRVVVETAGGISANAPALEAVMTNFYTVWLKASPEEHLERVVRQGDMRPMQGHARALENIRALLKDREACYQRADAVIDTSGRTVADSAQALVAAVRPLFAVPG